MVNKLKKSIDFGMQPMDIMPKHSLKVNIKSKFSALNLKRPAEEVHVPFQQKILKLTNEKSDINTDRAEAQPSADTQSSYLKCMKAQAQMARMHKPMVISLPNESPTGTPPLPYNITISIPTEKNLAQGPSLANSSHSIVPVPLTASNSKSATQTNSIPIVPTTPQQKILNTIGQNGYKSPIFKQPRQMVATPKLMDGCHIDRDAFHSHLNAAFSRRGFQQPIADDVVNILSLATQDYLKDIIEQVLDIAKHRYISNNYNSKTTKITNDVRGKFEFLNKLSNYLNKREAESITESLSDIEDKRALKLRRTQEQQLRLANQTAMAAIGLNRRKPEDVVPNKTPRAIKIVCHDVIFFMENDIKYAKSEMLYKAYEKYD